MSTLRSREAGFDGPVPSIVVIIPAHNEADALPACLTRLLRQDFNGTMRVIVAANGCDDETVAVAMGFRRAFDAAGHELEVIETPAASKPGALNAADSAAPAGAPRMYLDADVVLSAGAVAEVHRVLTGGGRVHLCAPRLRVAPARSRWTRGYATIWSRLPYIRDDVVGCGCYAVSAAGRRRWREFPAIVSDDKFVRLHFEAHERRVATDAFFMIQMPEGLRELIAVRGRWCRGNVELAERFPVLEARDRGRYLSMLRWVLGRPDLWHHLAVFLLVFLAGHLAAFCRRRKGLDVWERADRARRLLEENEAAAAQPAAAGTPVRTRTTTALRMPELQAVDDDVRLYYSSR